MRPSDSIADLLTRLRNACMIQRRFVDIPWSKIKEDIVRILKEQGFIQNFLVRKDQRQGMIRIFVKYAEGRKPVICGIERVSKPSVRRYVNYKEIPSILGGIGISIISTSQGVMSGMDARKRKIGGEILCNVW